MWEIELLEIQKKFNILNLKPLTQKVSKLTGILWLKHISVAQYKHFTIGHAV